MSAKIAAGRKIKASSNIYAALLALTLGVICATAALVAMLCYLRYETLFNIIDGIR